MDQEKRETGEELDLEVPNHAVKTLKRMWDSSKAQHVRLYLVGASVVFYTLFSIVSPLYLSLIHILRQNTVCQPLQRRTE